MGIRLMGADSQYRVEEQHTLAGPFYQISVVRDITSHIIMELVKNIDKRRRSRAAGPDRKAHPMGLAFSVIGILAQNDCLHAAKRRLMQSIEQIPGRRINGPRPVLLLQKYIQVFIIFFGKLRPERFQPVSRDRRHNLLLQQRSGFSDLPHPPLRGPSCRDGHLHPRERGSQQSLRNSFTKS